jgi:sugar phosphate permease
LDTAESIPRRLEDALAVPPEIAARYRYWRFRILYASMAGYAMFYIVRKNIGMALPSIGQELRINNKTLGLFLTLHDLLYAVSKFLNGMWGDRANPRIFMSVGLFLAATMSFCFGLGSTAVLFCVSWLCNGWFQGMGCAPCIKGLSNS